MLESVKRKIGKFMVSQRYLKGGGELRTFNKFFTEARDIVILMPFDDKDFPKAEKFISKLYALGKNLTLVLPQHKTNLIQGRQNYKLIEFSSGEINKFELPEKVFIAKINGKEFDIIIDLSSKESNFLLSVLFEINSPFRVGFKKNNSDKYYNFQTNYDEINTDISYENLLNSLSMF